MNEKGEDLQAGFPATHNFPTGSGVLRESLALPHTVTGLSWCLPGYLLVPASSLVKWPMRYSIWQPETPAYPQKYLHWAHHALFISGQHWRPLGSQFMHRGLRTRTWAQQLADPYSLLSRGERDSTVGRDVRAPTVF